MLNFNFQTLIDTNESKKIIRVNKNIQLPQQLPQPNQRHPQPNQRHTPYNPNQRPRPNKRPDPAPQQGRQFISSKYQNRLTVVNKIQQRVITPDNNIIDLHHNINSNLNSEKTLIHVLDNSNGFGDFLRGTILLSQYAKHFNINIKIDVSSHNINKCLTLENDLLTKEKINLICFNGDDKNSDVLYSLIETFTKSNETNLYITTNLYYNMNLVSEDIKYYINSFFNFKQQYHDTANELIKHFSKYNVLHIRCKDEYFNSDFDDNYLLTEIIKLQLSPNTIVLSNNYSLKRKINKLFGFYYIDKDTYHTGNISDYTELESTIVEYIILSKSSNTYCFSYYHHGSGFSEQCSLLYNIPYSVFFLPDKNMTVNNIELLINHYDNLNENNCITTSLQNNKCDSKNVAFITLTNTGYINYTLNCLESLKQINMEKQLRVYCVGEEGYSILKNNNFLCELINDNESSKIQEFRKNKWSNITYYKFEIIYSNLLNNDYVCITDGDIVYENNQVFDYLLNNIEDNDLLIQSEGIYHLDLCSGFMFIKSNDKTISIFNPENVKKYRNNEGWDDQIYVNAIRYKLKFKKLPLDLFPTGNYYYEYHHNIIQPYLIHFNWVVGDEKIQKMLHHNKWYMSKKVKICQHGTDGFGHQLEGTLRLLSLSINNKADYQYNFEKKYIFEHKNFEIDKLTNYLTYALKIISNNRTKSELKPFNVILKEQRSFNEILKNDKNAENTIYCYDGVSSNNQNILPPNFETNIEIEKSLPKLREAFVEKNIYLPSKSYDNNLINVCCHIRLGDAVGQRILENEKIFTTIQEFQKYNKYRVIIHTDGDVKHLERENTIIYDSNTDVLQVLSDFIHADILIINYSSLSISAHLLASNKQNVICPTNAGPTFKHRILNKCITISELLDKYKPM
jgi:hypothetical protein